MKNNMKRVLSLLLVVMMVAVMGSVMMISAGAENTAAPVATVNGTAYYSLNDAAQAAEAATLVDGAAPVKLVLTGDGVYNADQYYLLNTDPNVGGTNNAFDKVVDDSKTYDLEVKAVLKAYQVLLNNATTTVDTNGALLATGEALRIMGGTLNVKGNRVAGAVAPSGIYTGSWGGGVAADPAVTQVAGGYLMFNQKAQANIEDSVVFVSAGIVSVDDAVATYKNTYILAGSAGTYQDIQVNISNGGKMSLVENSTLINDPAFGMDITVGDKSELVIDSTSKIVASTLTLNDGAKLTVDATAWDGNVVKIIDLADGATVDLSKVTLKTADNANGVLKVVNGDVYLQQPVAKVGDVAYDTLQAAINAANGKTITLLADVTENITIADGAKVVLDLNGKTLYGYIAPCDPAELTVSNGSIINNNSAVSAIEINAGKLTLTDVDIDSARHGVRIDGAVTATIDGGEYKLIATSGTRHAVNISGAANVTIKSGTFVGPKGTTMDSGAAVNVQAGATVTIEGGDFSKGKNNTLGVSGTLSVKGGTFDQDPTAYLAAGYAIKAVNGTYTVGEAVAKIGDTYYITLEDALKAITDGCTVTLLKDITIGGTWDCRTNGAKITASNVKIIGNGKTLKLTGAVDDKNWNTVFRVEGNDVWFHDLTIDVSEATGVQRGISAKLSIAVTECTFKGNADAKRAIIYGEGAGAAISDIEVNVVGSEFINWTYGVSDNQNAQDAQYVNIDGNTFTNANVLVSAYERIEFTNNKMSGGYVNISSYSVPNELVVKALNSKVDDAFAADNKIVAKTILNASDKFQTPVAEINGVLYLDLADALNAAAAATGNVTVEILADINLTGVVWTPVTISDPGYPMVTVNGNYKTITGLTDMLFAGTWAGGSGLIINDLTIKDSTIVNDENDAKGTVGVGAFIGFPQASATITLNNCHLVNSTVKGGHWTGGLIGYAAGYAGTDGPVFMNLTIKDCSVTGSTISGKGSVGGIIGHATGNAWTGVVIETTTVSGNTVTSTGSSTNKAGAVIGTIGAAGQATTVNGVEKTGGVAVSATVSGNTVTSNGTTITTVYGRQGTPTGMLEIAGGSYDSKPIEDNVAYAAPIEGYMLVENSDGTYGIAVDPAYGKVAKIGDTYYATLDEALAVLQADGGTLELLADASINASVVVLKDTVINGNGKKLTVTGAYGIDVKAGVNLAINNLTVESDLYALNLRGASDNAKVTITDSDLTGCIALNVWGKNVVVDATNSAFTSVDTSTHENYTAIALNNNGAYSAENTVINITGGSITALDENGAPSVAISNATATGVAKASDTTVVTGEIREVVSIVTYNGYDAFYSHFTLQDSINRAANDPNATVKLLKDITISEKLVIEGNVVIDGNGKTITYTGTDRAIDVPNTANGANVTIKNLTLAFTGGYSQRGINYNTNGKLILDNVTVNGTDVTYAVNLPSSSTNAEVEINNSSITGLIALNVWGANAKVDVTNTALTSVDKATHENYAAVKLNNNGTDSAEGATITINGGSITAKDENGNPSSASTNATATGKIIISDTTTVTGNSYEYVAAVLYNGANEFYGFASLQDAIEKAANDPKATVKLLKDITISEKLVIEGNVVIDGNGKTITYTGTDRAIDVPNTANGANVTIKNLTLAFTGGYSQRGINYNTNGKLILDNVTVNGTNVTYAVNLPSSSTNAEVEINNSSITGLIALNVWGANAEVVATNSHFTSVDANSAENYAAVKLNSNGTDSAEGATITITGGSITAKDENGNLSSATTNATATGVITISDTTVVTGNHQEIVAAVLYSGASEFYGCFTLKDAIEKAENDPKATVKLLKDITISEPITINGNVVIDGNGKTITYTGTDRIMDVVAADVKLTLKDINLVSSASYCQRGISIGNNVDLTLDNVSVKGTNVTYALNLAGASDNAKVTITDSDLTGCIALNVWGKNVIINATNSEFVSVDTATHENYTAIALNNNGAYSAENTVITVTGGKITALDENGAPSIAIRNASATGVVNVSNTTVVTGEIREVVAIVTYNGYDEFYSHFTLQDSINKAANDPNATVKLLKDIELSEILVINGAVTIDGNGHKITSTANRAINIDTTAEVTIENLTIVGSTGCARGINIINQAGTTNLSKVKISGVSHYAVHVATSAGAAKVNIADSELSGYAALAVYGEGSEVVVSGSALSSVNEYKDNGSNSFATIVIAANNAEIRVEGGSVSATAEAGKAPQAVVGMNAGRTNMTLYLNTELVKNGTATLLDIDPAAVNTTLRAEYAEKANAEGYAVIEAANGMITVKAAVAKIGNTCYETLAKAVAAAKSGDIIILMNGEHELPVFSGKELTFKGETMDGVIINDAPDARTQGWIGSTIHFENLTAKGATANYHGLANGVVAVTYKDCNVNGLRFLYAQNVSFENCAFNANGVEHSFWTYGASNITVTNCTFTYTDRAVNCYSENGANHEVDIAFTDCTFTYAGTSDAPEGAVEINSSSVKSIELTMDDCTAPVKGAMWFNSQWDGKKGQNTVVKVDGEFVWKPLKGTGTAEDPILINDLADLILFRDQVDSLAQDGSTQFAGKYFKLTADIDLAGINWNPIGTMFGDHGSFKGVFDGDNHTIYNLNVQQAGNGLGLFARTAGNAVIKNLNLHNVTVKSTDNSSYVGALVGNSYASTKINNVHVTGTIDISGRGYIGGISGHGYVVMDNVSVVGTGTISSTFWCAGGILGYAGEGATNIMNAHVEGIAITSAAGGLGAIVGMAEDNNGTQPISGSNLSAKDVVIKTYTGAYGDSYANYALGYLYGGNPTSKLTGTLSVENVNITTSTGETPKVNDAVAQIGTAIYFDLQSAINAGGEIKILRDVTLNDTLTIPAGKVVTLDLNGKTVSMVYANDAAANHEMIKNYGALTIQDTVGGGKLSYKYTGANLGTSYAANTITTEPGSTLIVKGGTIENLTYDSAIIAYAIDGRTNGGLGDVTVTIEGGTITSLRQAVRIFANSTTNTGTLNISGGEITGRVIVQNASAKANKAALSITGGTFNANAYKTDVLYVGGSNSATIDIDASVSGGTFKGEITETHVESFISGGTYTQDVSAWCVDGYVCEENADGTYGVREEKHLVIVVSPVAPMSTTTITVATMDDAVAYALANEHDFVTYQITGPVVLTTGGSHGIINLGNNVTIEGVTPDAKLTIVGGGVPDFQGVTFKNITLADEGTYLPTANEFMYQNYIDCTFVNVTFEEGIRVSGNTTIKNCTINSEKVNQYALWSDGGTVTMNGTTVVVDGEGYGMVKSDNATKYVLTNNTFVYKNEANKEALNTKDATIDASDNTFIGCAEGIIPADKTNYAADGTTVLTAEAIAAGNLIAVAKISDTYYETLDEAIEAAQAGETITILAGTLEEGTIKMPASLKNVTIKGEVGAVLKNMTIMAYDGNTICYEGLTFDGIVFENSRISITGWRAGGVTVKDLTVTNCVFQNLDDTTNSAPIHINMAATEAVENFTFTNNVIDGATGGQKSGIYAQVTGKVVVSDNVINNVSFRPYVIQITTDDGIADELIVTGNTFSGSAAGRAQCLGNNAAGTDTVKLVVSGNIFKGITSAQQICYWNFNPDTTSADLSKNYYDIDILANPGKIYFNKPAQNAEDLLDMGVFPYYADEAMTQLVEAPAIMVTYPDGKIEYYDNMLEAVPYTTNCPRLEGAIVTLLSDIEAPGIRMMENGMVLDLNGHTYTITAGTGSQGTNTSGFQIRPEVTETATIKNGTIKVAAGAPVIWMFNVYATNFVVEDVIVDCDNMAYSYGESCYVVVSRAGDNVQLTGETKFINFNSTVAGYIINVGDTMTIGEYVTFDGTIELDAGATLTAPAGLKVVTADGHTVVYNNGVYTSTQVVAKIGNTVFTTLDAAFAAAQPGDEVKIMVAGTYALTTSGKDITITGAVAGVVFDNIGAKNMGGANVTFNNVTFNYASDSTYKGLQHSGNLVYNNCTINGQVFLYGESETFNECTFNTTDANNYNVWTYGAKKVAFNECTFNSAGKSVLIYKEGDDASFKTDVIVTDCDFIASAPVDGKAAIEMDSSLIAGIKLTIDADTTATGFGSGNVSGNSLWNNKKGNNTDANNDITVVVNGETVLAPVTFVAYIDKTGSTSKIGYTSINDALAAAQPGETVTILAGDYAQDLNINKAITVIGETLDDGYQLVTILGRVNVTADGATVKGLYVYDDDTGLYINAKDVLIEGCEIVGAGWAGLYQSYTTGTVTFKNSKIVGATYGINFGGSEGGNIVIDGCTIQGWTSFASTINKVTIKDSSFSADAYYKLLRFYQDAEVINTTFPAGMRIDSGNGGTGMSGITLNFTDCSVDGADFETVFPGSVIVASDITVDGKKLVRVAKIGNTYYETLEEALANVADGTTIKLVANATLDYNAREAYGRLTTTDIIIDGQGFTLTLNQKDSDWSSIGMANPDGKLTLQNMTIEKVGYGDTAGAWNTHAINFTCNVEMNNVTVNQSMSVENGATLNNVTINEANGYYGLWIDGNGQSVTINGGAINATNGGRGIKIADQYIDAPASVNLTVDGMKFNTAKKAAVLVSSKAGAAITAANVDITNVAEDSVNFVWVDEDWAADYGKVTVTGGSKAQESVDKFTVTIMDGDEVAGYYETFVDALNAAKANDTIVLLPGTFTGGLTINKSGITVMGTLDENGAYATFVQGTLKISGSDITVKNLSVFNGGGNGGSIFGGNILVEHCEVTGANGFRNCEANNGNVTIKDSVITGGTYGIHFGTGAGEGNVIIDGCKVTGWTSFGAAIEKVTITNTEFLNGNLNQLRLYQDAELTNVKFNPNMTIDFGQNNVRADFNGCSVTDGSALTNIIYLADIVDMGVQVYENDQLVVPAARIVNGNAFMTLAEAVAAAQDGDTIVLVANTTGSGVVINKDITIDFGTYTYTVNQTVGSAGTTTLGFQILKDNNVTLKNGKLAATTVVSGKPVKMLIQNYANLTLTDMVLDGTGSADMLYVLSNNSGNIVVNGATSITAPAGAVAFDVYDYSSAGYTVPSMSINTTGTITGKIEVSDTATLAISGGTFTAKIAEAWCAEGFVPTVNADGTYTVMPEADAEAKIDGVYYTDFKKALEAAKAGDTIVLLQTAVIDSDLTIENVTIKAEGFNPAIRIVNDANVIVNNVTIESENYAFILGASDGSTAGNLTINSGSFKAVTTVASVTMGTLTINGGAFRVDAYENGQNFNFMLNCIDDNYRNGSAKIVVNGGTFYNFNPADNAAEGARTSFVADGYHSMSNGNGSFTVSEHKREDIPAIGATCTATGLTKGVKCSDCGKILEAQTVVPVKGHSVLTVTVDATCTSIGFTYSYCTVCNTMTKAPEILTKLEHSYTSVYTDATIYADAYTTYTCACGHTYVETHKGTMKVGGLTVDGVWYKNWADAMADIADGAKNVVLYSNVENAALTKISSREDLTIDLNGYKLDVAYLWMNGYSTVNVIDSSARSTGSIDTIFYMSGFDTTRIASDVEFSGTVQMNNIKSGWYSRFFIGEELIIGEKGYFVPATDEGSVVINHTNGIMDVTLTLGHLVLKRDLTTLGYQKITISVYGHLTIDERTIWTIDKDTEIVVNSRGDEHGIIDGEGFVKVNSFEHFKTILDTDIKNIIVGETIVIDKDLVIDDENLTITVDGITSAPAFRVLANVEFKAGIIDTTAGSSCYPFIVGDGSTAGNLTVTGGELYGRISAVSVTKGTLTINGGYFEATEYNGAHEFTINCIDANYRDGSAKVIINGGSFYRFDPKNSIAEGELIDFTQGLCSVKKCDVYTVKAHNEVIDPAKDATCTESGLTEGKHCSNCGEIFVAQTEIAVLPHSYNAVVTAPTYTEMGYTTYTCSVCNDSYVSDYVDKLEAVAQVGDTFYGTLAEAFAAAQAGETITLLTNATGSGVIINKDITIDFAGYTYTFNEGVGSTGTESNGFQILKGNGNKVTLKNGTLNVAAAEAGKFYTLIQNYADLTVTDMILDGTNLDKWSFTDGDSYTLSINSGNVVVNGNTTIIANNDGALAYAFDACANSSYTLPTVDVADSVKVIGNVEAPAKVGNVYYATFAQAYAAAKAADETLVLLETAVIDSDMTIENVTIEAEGFNPAIRIVNDANVIVNNVTIESSGYAFILGASDESSAGNLTINSGSFKAGITVASVTKGTLTINGGEFSADPYQGSYAYVINCIDANYNKTAFVVINGGRFRNFDPQSNAAEGANTNFVAEGYYAKHNGDGTWTVLEQTEVIIRVDDDSKIYGDKDPAFTYTVNGKQDPLPGLTVTIRREDGVNVGTYAINATVTADRQYNVTVVPGTLEIKKRTATIYLDDITYVKGNVKPESFLHHYQNLVGSDVVLMQIDPVGIDFDTVSTHEYTVKVTISDNYNVNVVPGKVTVYEAAAQVGDIRYATFAEAYAVAKESNATIILRAPVVITEDTTLDLAGLTITSSGDAFIVKDKATLTINGDGIVEAGTSGVGSWCAVWANGGHAIINGGTYSVGGDTSTTDTTHQNDVIYTKNGGTVVINGGKFLNDGTVWTLNENDSNRKTITVKGGTFENWDPMNNVSEGAGTSFVAEGYRTIREGNNYVVTTRLLGDASGDGKIDTLDVIMILDYTADLIDETQIDLAAADFNGDGKVNSRDVKKIREYLAAESN